MRQWIADASRANVQWANLPRPDGLSLTEYVIAAGVAELLASRAGVNPPAWTSSVGAAPGRSFSFVPHSRCRACDGPASTKALSPCGDAACSRRPTS